MTAPRRRATYEELMEVPDHLVAEIIDGELITSPRPASPHAWATSRIGGALDGFSRKPGSPGALGGWWIVFEPELHFPDGDVLVPDIAGWRRERMPEFLDVAAFTLAPDWLCEVISPRSGRIDRTRKLPIYGRQGVAWVWLVDPIARTLEVFRLDDGRWVLAATHGGDTTTTIAPFPEIALALDGWWMPSAEPAR